MIPQLVHSRVVSINARQREEVPYRSALNLCGSISPLTDAASTVITFTPTCAPDRPQTPAGRVVAEKLLSCSLIAGFGF